jgi:hypothetical protein
VDSISIDTCPDDDLRRALVQGWNVEVPSAGPSREGLLEALAARVLHLMRHDFSRLTSALYLLDVREDRYLEALRAPGEQNAARRLAELILEREEEKAISRGKYSRVAVHESPMYPVNQSGEPP